MRFFAALTLFVLTLAGPAVAEIAADFDPQVRSQIDEIRRLRSDQTPLVSAPRKASLSLAAQFTPGRRDFDQGEINVCHDVTAVALLEAAIYRQYGERVKLSSADLFLLNTVLRRSRQEAAAREHSVFNESDSMSSDLNFAVSRGVAPESAVPYAKFLRAYLPFKASASRVPDEKLAAYQKSWVERFYAKQDSFWGGKIERERAAVQEKAAEFKVVTWLLKGDKMEKFNPHALPAAECYAEGREQERFILDQLNAGRPVAVGFDATGLPGPAADAKEVQGHAAVIDGFGYEGGRPVFTLMNAWGLKLTEDQLCRIDEMGAIAVPKDEAPAGASTSL